MTTEQRLLWATPAGTLSVTRCRLLALLISAGACSCAEEESARTRREPTLDFTTLSAAPAGRDVVDHLERWHVDDAAVTTSVQCIRGHVERPWTVERLAAARAAAADVQLRAALVYLLAASRDGIGLRVAGKALSDPDPEVAISAALGIKTYWIGPLPPNWSSEDLLAETESWWRQRLAQMGDDESRR